MEGDILANSYFILGDVINSSVLLPCMTSFSATVRPGASWLTVGRQGRPADRQVLRHRRHRQDRELPRHGEVGPTGGDGGLQHAQGRVDHLRM